MTRLDSDVVVVGAGLSGLRVAALLSANAVPCIVLEARGEIGGRALSVTSTRAGGARFDLGPTWYWPQTQPRMKRLVAELGLPSFAQYSDGSVWIERFRFEQAQRYVPPAAAVVSAMRLEGGLQSLIARLSSSLPEGCVRLGKRVLSLDFTGKRVELEVADVRSGVKERSSCRAVITAFAPRLLAGNLRLTPALPAALRARFSRAPTWLGGQAKALAVYESPFWRAQGHSGLVSSVVGPLQEIHDASPQEGAGALFGFFGISAAARRGLTVDRLRELVLAQLVRLFGSPAARPLDFFYKDWTEEPSIAAALDREVPSQYPQLLVDGNDEDPWAGRLLFAGSELALEHQGYLEGALEAAERAASRVRQVLA